MIPPSTSYEWSYPYEHNEPPKKNGENWDFLFTPHIKWSDDPPSGTHHPFLQDSPHRGNFDLSLKREWCSFLAVPNLPLRFAWMKMGSSHGSTAAFKEKGPLGDLTYIGDEILNSFFKGIITTCEIRIPTVDGRNSKQPPGMYEPCKS